MQGSLHKKGSSVVISASKSKKHRQKTCKEMFTCSTGWSQMRLRTQIILKLVLIIFLLFAIYMVVLIIIFEFYYKPDVLGHFRQELESVHSHRTSNMTVSISSRFETFNLLTYDNVGKMRKLLQTTYQDSFDPKVDLPFEWRENDYPDHCTTGVSNSNQ